MKAAVYYGPGDIRVEQRPEPKPTNENIIVKIHCCAICGTDLKLATVGNPRCHPPRIIGHEMVGSITHVGKDIRGFSVNERITLATTVACGTCQICALNLGNMCPSAKPISYDFDGAFAEYIAIPPQAISGGNVVKVPDSVPDETASLSEPLSCAINAQELINVKNVNSVLIIGAGPLGAIHAELAKANGARVVMISEYSKQRLSMVRKITDIIVIDAGSQNIESIVKKNTSGLGADAVIVCAPSQKAQESSLQYARKGGAISLFASLPKGVSDTTFDSRIIHYNELRIIGASDSRPEHVRKAVSLMAEKKISTQAIITHHVSLDEIQKGIELMKNKESLKVLVYPRS